ncbi:hypothetical protein V8C43DRAFT_284106 [Trichoderma afarasin]
MDGNFRQFSSRQWLRATIQLRQAAFQFRRFFLQPPALSTSCRCPSFIFASSPAVTVICYD